MSILGTTRAGSQSVLAGPGKPRPWVPGSSKATSAAHASSTLADFIT